ncbi:UvrD-helicase domain-containing protein [Microbacterium sp.]
MCAPSCASSIRVVLLDEYQDTSVIQTRFLAALFRESR